MKNVVTQPTRVQLFLHESTILP